MNRILVSGYYGFANSGDDALLGAIIQNMREYDPDMEITVLSKNPAETRALYGVESINRYNMFQIMSRMKKAKLLISGGGSLLQDRTSSKSLYYYLTIIRLAQTLGTKVMLYANGIGPLTREKNIKKTMQVLEGADFITLRDENSMQELLSHGLKNPNRMVTADPALTLEAGSSDAATAILRGAGFLEEGPFCVVSVRNWKDLTPDFEKQCAAALDALSQKHGVTPVFLPMQLPGDLEISRRIASQMKEKAVMLEARLDIGDVLAIIQKAELVVGMRLHTLIYAASCAVAAIGLVYDPKVKGFLDYVGQKLYVDTDGFSAGQLTAAVEQYFENRDELRQSMRQNSKKLKEKARQNAAFAWRLMQED